MPLSPGAVTAEVVPRSAVAATVTPTAETSGAVEMAEANLERRIARGLQANAATLKLRDRDYLLDARILQRVGFTVYVTDGDYSLSIQPPGKAISNLQRRKDIFGEVLHLGLNARPMPVLYPRTFEIVRSLGVAQYDLREYAGLGHSSSQEEIDDVEQWLSQVLPPLPA